MAKKVVKNNSQKVQISMPKAILDELDMVSEKLGVSRSAYIYLAVSQKLYTDKMMAYLPDLMALSDKLASHSEDYPQIELDLNSKSTLSE